VIEEPKPEYRTGIGTDIHRIVEGRKLMLGGVYVPYPAGLAGHSDGDVGLHAVIDALLGASGMGDIGTLFPDTDPQFKNADSKELLFIVKERLEEKRWEVASIDLIIHAEEPKLEAVKGQMKRCIAGLLGIDFTAVNVKAKTNEGLGDVGAGEAMAATAIALLKKKKKRRAL
jgi:2-C-methyl-D-erythritol 2,4-cyclodiphosphate synthase